MTHVFHFAVPTKGGTRAQREGVLRYIAATYGITGKVSFVRSEPLFRLYRIEYEA